MKAVLMYLQYDFGMHNIKYVKFKNNPSMGDNICSSETKFDYDIHGYSGSSCQLTANFSYQQLIISAGINLVSGIIL